MPTLESFLENADHGYQLSMGKQVLLGKFPFVDFFFHYTAQRHKAHLPTLRLYSVYGPYEEPSHLMPTLIAQGLQGKLPPLVNPDIARDYVYVDDVNEAYILA
ncbi:MAG: NAD-dependent epimerase/dehydratase family protein, partial [Cyanobacteria bacterium P01_G01_bin.38]